MSDASFPPYPQKIERFSPQKIQTDAQHLQFKSGGNDKGITGQLTSVKDWEDAFSGVVYIWQKSNGALFIADGHQRLGLAQELKTKPDGSPIELRGYRFREDDGWTVEKMRVFAAAKNIAEGGESTKAMDVAKLLRNGGTSGFLEKYIPPKRRCYIEGKHLANLSDDCFNLVLNGAVSENAGIVVGELVQEKKEQIAVMDFLRRQKTNGQTGVRELVVEAIHAGFSNMTQQTMFGESDYKHALIEERIAVFKAAQKQLCQRQESFKGFLQQDGEFYRGAMEARTLTTDHTPSPNAANSSDDAAHQLYVCGTRHRLLVTDTMLAVLKTARHAGSPLSAHLTDAAHILAEKRDSGLATAFFLTKLEAVAAPYIPKALNVSSENPPNSSGHRIGKQPPSHPAASSTSGLFGGQTPQATFF